MMNDFTSAEDLALAKKLLVQEKRRRERIASGEIKGYTPIAEQTKEQQIKTRAANARYNARIVLTMRAFEDSGSTITEADIDNYLKDKTYRIRVVAKAMKP